MSTEWFRRSSWSDHDREEFYARLKRSRSAGKKAQYLRIQASYLAQAGYHSAAIELLDQMIAMYPERTQLAQAHVQKAESLAKLGRVDGAIQEFREALQAERDIPNVRTNAWLDYAWFVVKLELAGFYDEVSRVLMEFRDERGIKLPALEYRYAAVQALLAEACGEMESAQDYANRAFAEAAKSHSGLRNHPNVGLVGSEDSVFKDRLRALAGR